MSLLDKIKNVDYFIFSQINGEWHNPFLDTVLPFLRQSYLWIPLYFFLIIFAPLNFKRKGWYWSLGFILTAILSDYISSTLIKGTVLRLRPCQYPMLMQHIRLLTSYCPGNSSFTSSHAVNHFAAAMYIFATFKNTVSKWWALLFIWALVISYTQVYVGVHFPADVICGALAGLIIGYLPAQIFNKKDRVTEFELTGMSDILILAALIIINGLVVLSEIALISAKKSRLDIRAVKGDDKAKTALKLQERPEVFLSTAQIFITVIAILEGVYSAERFNKYLTPTIEKIDFLKPYAVTIATVIIVLLVTFLSIIFGELLPKRIGLIKAESIARGTAKPMYFLSRVTHPIVWLLTKTTNLIFKIFKITRAEDNKVTEEEIKAMVSEGSEHGAIQEEEKEIIERVFHLGDRNITSLMTHRTDIVWFDVNESIDSIREKIKECLHSVYPLCDGDIDTIKGVVYIKDMYLRPDAPLITHLKKALFVPENNSAYQVLEKFKQTKVHYAFIVDEYGTMHGMITINDILKAIVGEMPEDEDDDYSIVERADGSYLVDAQIQFYDFLTRFEKTEWMNDGEQEFDTLAGFILHELKHIPSTGEIFDWRGFTFEIVDMDGHRIDKVIVTISKKLKEEIADNAD